MFMTKVLMQELSYHQDSSELFETVRDHAIRPLIYSDGGVHFWVGDGIVADSQMEAEFQDTLDKAKATLLMLRQEPQFRSGARL